VTKKLERFRSVENATSFKIRERQKCIVKMGKQHFESHLKHEELDPIESTLTYDMQKDHRYAKALTIIDNLGIKEEIKGGLNQGIKGLFQKKNLPA